MAANNQDIAHLKIGGRTGLFPTLACKRTDAHIAVDAARFALHPRQCKRCAAKLAKMQAVSNRQQMRAFAAELTRQIETTPWEPV